MDVNYEGNEYAVVKKRLEEALFIDFYKLYLDKTAK
jgi:hypothetical protein